MQITAITLKGHKKIINGLGKDIININLSDSNGIILIQGPNGIGKSTILSELTPFPSASSNWVGYATKMVNFTLDGDDYLVEYHWKDGKPVDAFFNKSRRGNIDPLFSDEDTIIPMTTKNTFAAVVEALELKLGLDPNYEALTCLSSYDNKSFALLRPAERKKFLNTIVQNLDVYNNIYKTLSKRSSIFKAMINSLTMKISNIGGNPLDFGELIRQHQAIVDSLTQEKSQHMKTILEYDMTPEQLEEYSHNVTTLTNLREHYRNLNSEIKQASIRFFDTFHFRVEINQVSNILAFKENMVDELSTKRDQYRAQQVVNDSSMVSCRKNIYEYSKLLNDCTASEDYKLFQRSLSASFKSELESSRLMIKETEERYDSNILQESVTFVRENFDLQTFQRFCDLFKVKIIECMEIENSTSIAAINEDTLEKYKKFAKKYISEQDNLLTDKILDFKHAVYDMIKDHVATVDGKYPVDILDEMDLTIMNIRELHRWNSVRNQIKQLITLFKFPTFWQVMLERIVWKLDVEMKDLIRFYDEISSYKHALDFVREFNESTEVLKNGSDIDKHILEYKDFIKQNQDALDKCESDAIMIKANIEEIDIDIDLCRRIIVALRKIDSMIKNSDSIRDRLELLDKLIKPMPDLRDVQDRIKEIDKKLKEENDIIYNLRYSSDLFNEYMHELSQVENNYSRLETLKKHCSPTSGIQIIFIDLYINKILEMANKLLSMFFGGEFVIQPFKITDKEFQIPIKGNGLLIDDISSLSASQMAIANMCISFAIMMHSSSKMNILRLDEMDAPLDERNAYMFPKLIQEVMNSLKCEQAFVITHSLMAQNSNEYKKIQVDKL